MGPPSVRRRAFLSAAAGTAAATAGCVSEIQNLAGRDRPQQVSLSISTLPATADPYAVRIANHLAGNLSESGIATTVDPMSPDVLRRETLVNQDFDLYVTRYPGQSDPDELRSLLYSAYAEESGWQNPVGFTDLTVDELLDEQRTLEGEPRREVVAEIQRLLVRDQPLTVVCFPDRIAATRADRFTGWPVGGPRQLVDYLQLDRAGESSTLRALLWNDRPTRNRNPLSVEYRNRGNLTDILYEPLVRIPPDTGSPIPWLARRIEFDDEGGLAATLRLRDTAWHDGEAVTPEDVAFTYEFLRDTSMGSFETPVPTPWRRGRISLVDSVEILEDDRLRFEFATTNRELAYRGLSVSVLPRHIWREWSGPAEIAGIDVSRTTEALVVPNEESIGSGPFRLESATPEESLTFVAFDDHFLYGTDTEGIPERFRGQPPERIEFTVAPSREAVTQLLSNGEADVSADGLEASLVPRIVRDDEVSISVTRDTAFYHVGYNCRRAPMTDPRFRRIVAGHLDRAFIVEDALDSYGIASEVPLGGRWVPEDLEWDGEATVPFYGDDGELDTEAARGAFREAGYQYDGDQLVRRGEG